VSLAGARACRVRHTLPLHPHPHHHAAARADSAAWSATSDPMPPPPTAACAGCPAWPDADLTEPPTAPLPQCLTAAPRPHPARRALGFEPKKEEIKKM
jgi:hypothetical protein